MSLDVNNLLFSVKRAAVEAVKAQKPFGLTFGKVTSIAPLRIMVDQKMELVASQLILTSSVRDFTVNMTLDHAPGDHSHTHDITDSFTGGGSASTETHRHTYSGPKAFRVNLGLKIGEQVILLQADGGQKFIVLDRVEG